jgi:copper homeostasis protein
VAEARAAAELGADSVELCVWPLCGGLTPSHGLLKAILHAVDIPVRVLVRSHPWRTDHRPDERSVLSAELASFNDFPVGLVTGGLEHHGQPDQDLLREMATYGQEQEITFHRAIDRSADIGLAMQQCMEHGIHRMLTSGGQASALAGAGTLERMVRQAGGRIQVAAAGGVMPGHVVELVERTGVTEVHFLAQKAVAADAHEVPLSSSRHADMAEMEPDRAKIDAIMNALVKAGMR